MKNQIRLLTASLPQSQTANILVMFKVGSRYESNKFHGASHFVEHLMFKGTKKRPDTLSLSKVLDGVGAEFNAFTNRDYTGYYIKADAKNLSLAIDVLSDMLLNSKFEAKEIEKEKGVIVEEINMYEDNPLMYVEELLEQAMFTDNPLSHSVAGDRKSVRAFSRKDLAGYRDSFYTGKNTVISLAGKFDKDHLKEISSKFSFVSGKGINKFKRIKLKQKSPRVVIKYKDTEQTQLALGLPAYSYLNPKAYALQLLSVILGGNMSSRLFLNVREKRGLAYFVRSWPNFYEDCGNLIIQSGLDKSRIEEAIKVILAELLKLKKGVRTDELKRAKDYLVGRAKIDLEDTESLAQWYASQELFTRKVLTPEEKYKKIMAVSLKEVDAVAKEVVDLKKTTLALIGPFKEEKRFKKIIYENRD
ncbi:MAG: pitrilysin family protein [Patescibacteria group bacterium]